MKKKMRKIIALALCTVCAVSLLGGCKKEDKKDAKKHIEVSSHMLNATLDAAANYNAWVLTRMAVGETLVKLDDNVRLVPCVADEWKMIDDTTWEFHIREGVKFHNGKTVDAEAVKRCYEYAWEQNSRFQDYLNLKEIKADGQTLTFITNEPNAALQFNLAEPLFCVMDVTGEDLAHKPVGTGPFKVTSFTEEIRVECERFDDYWDGKALLDSFTYTKIGSAEARVLALQSGETEMTVTIDNTNLKLFDNKDYNVSVVTGLRTNVVKMNLEREFLKDVEVRRAICYAIDRESYSKNITGAELSYSLFPTSLPYDITSLNTYTYDVNKANELLDAAGYVDTDGDGIREMNGKNIHLEYYQSSAHGSDEAGLIAQAIQSDLKKIGISVTIESTENLSDIKNSGNFDFYSDNSNTAPTGDAQYFLTTMYDSTVASNKTHYNNPEFDALLAKMNSTFDVQARYDLAHQAAQLLLDDAADIYVTSVNLNTVSKSYVKNATQPTVDYYMMTKDIDVVR